jgi:hypothetical protein
LSYRTFEITDRPEVREKATLQELVGELVREPDSVYFEYAIHLRDAAGCAETGVLVYPGRVVPPGKRAKVDGVPVVSLGAVDGKVTGDVRGRLAPSIKAATISFRSFDRQLDYCPEGSPIKLLARTLKEEVVRGDQNYWYYVELTSGKPYTTRFGWIFGEFVISDSDRGFAVKSNGTLWTFGSNDHGQLGDGTTYNHSLPVMIMDGVIAAAGGEAHSLALKADGSVWAWGWNSTFQLGDGTNFDRDHPVQVLTPATAVAAWYYNSRAIGDTSLWIFGGGNDAALPTRLAATGVTSVAVGRYHTLILKSDGSVWAFGDNSSGQLGVRSASDYSPAPVKVMEAARGIAAGELCSYVILKDGRLFGFGDNSRGQLGENPREILRDPVEIQIPKE